MINLIYIYLDLAQCAPVDLCIARDDSGADQDSQRAVQCAGIGQSSRPCAGVRGFLVRCMLVRLASAGTGAASRA